MSPVNEMFLHLADAAHVQMTENQSRVVPHCASSLARLVPSQEVVVFREQPFHPNLGLLRVVSLRVMNPRSRCRVLVQLSTDRVLPRQSGSNCGENDAHYCVFARTVAQKSWPTLRQCKSQGLYYYQPLHLESSNTSQKNRQIELLPPENELLQTIALQKGDAIAQCFCNSAPVREAANYFVLAQRNLQ